LASGDHGTRLMPQCRAAGTCSVSAVRSSSEYSSCSATGGAQPCRSASMLAAVAYHAGTLLSPTARAFPSATICARVAITSATGVAPSHRCSQNTST